MKLIHLFIWFESLWFLPLHTFVRCFPSFALARSLSLFCGETQAQADDNLSDCFNQNDLYVVSVRNMYYDKNTLKIGNVSTITSINLSFNLQEKKAERGSIRFKYQLMYFVQRPALKWHNKMSPSLLLRLSQHTHTMDS